jgi:hypothetical protein
MLHTWCHTDPHSHTPPYTPLPLSSLTHPPTHPPTHPLFYFIKCNMWYLICSMHGPTLLTLPLRVETLRCTQWAKSLVSLHSKVMWSPLYKHLRHHWQIHLGFTIWNTMCFQFSMSNIYHPYGCHSRADPLLNDLLVSYCRRLVHVSYLLLSTS